jgi:tetratricopeptide (TPR) repeat protein
MTILLMAALCAPAAVSPQPTLDAAFQRLYNFDFAGAQAAATRYVSANGEDPMGYAVRAASHLFSELNRTNALSKPVGEERLLGGRDIEPDERARAEFWKATKQARAMAESRLRRDAKDRDALAAMAVVAGLERDYLALIDKKLRKSMDSIKEAQSFSTRLLAVDGQAYDAYLNTGFSEYLLGSFPAVLRWVVKVNGVEGDKEKGLLLMRKAAENGRYMRGFAQLLLAHFYLKEGRREESEKMLRAMLRDYPENAVIKRELSKISQAAD